MFFEPWPKHCVKKLTQVSSYGSTFSFCKYFKISQKTKFAVIESPTWTIDVITIIIQRRVSHFSRLKRFLAGVYLLKVNNRNTRTRHEICSKLTTKRPERVHWSRSSVLVVNFEHTSHLILVFLLLTLNMQLPAGLFRRPKQFACLIHDHLFEIIHLLKLFTNWLKC